MDPAQPTPDVAPSPGAVIAAPGAVIATDDDVPPIELVLCGYCDAVHRRTEAAGHKTMRCATCDSPLYRGNRDLGAMLAVTLTAAIAFFVANALPLLTLT